MKILEITNYTAGGCGVGMRVLNESRLLSEKGHEVVIFSTNNVKGSKEICASEEVVNGVNIKRFSSVKLGGESYMYWNFESEALKFNPDVIIVHAYRHIHVSKALKVAKKLKCKIFLVTHAPFARKSSRSFLENLIVNLYDKFIGRKQLRKFTGIIAITKWEYSHLKDLGVNINKIYHIPNGISKEFFKPIKSTKSSKLIKIVYTGRVSPIKNLEILVAALSKIKGFDLEIMGPGDSDYLIKLKSLANENNLKNINFISKKYNSSEQIKELDRSEIFVIPSKSEGMPQTLVEAMARGKIVVCSDNEGNKELVKDNVTGFLFKNEDSKDLERVLKLVQNSNKKDLALIKIKARAFSENYKWDKIIQKLESLISQ
jgi:glycosyltransferase involved in cell wall biosynthesis